MEKTTYKELCNFCSSSLCDVIE